MSLPRPEPEDRCGASSHALTAWFVPQDPAGRRSSSPVRCRSSSPEAGGQPDPAALVASTFGGRATRRIDSCISWRRWPPDTWPSWGMDTRLCGPPDLHREPPPVPLSAEHIIEQLRALLPAIREEHR
ncbi:MAG: hypothetical protein ACRDS0_10525 [Pseudonocardiaceae bacterium]